MLLFLVRHSNAVDPAGRRDEDRPLTPEGRFQLRRSVSAIQSETQDRYEQIITSPLVRAVQSAEILASIPGYSGVVEVSRLLVPAARPKETLALFQYETKNTVLVGHEPAMSALASELLGCLVPPFKKGAVWLLERSAQLPGVPQATFRWALQPRTGQILTTLDALANETA
jgi:phosphohistidine phosphatase